MNDLLPFTTALGLALVHSLWIGGLLYVLVRTLLPLLPSPVARHHFAYGALVGLAVAFGYTLSYFYEPAVTVCENLVASIPTELLAAPATIVQPTDRLLAWLETVAPWLSYGYLLGLFPAALLLYREQQRVSTLINHQLTPLPTEWLERLGDELNRHSVTRNVRCFLSERAGEAMTLGFWRPIIVMPVALATQLTPAMAHTILLHEIAHLRHYDHWLNYPQQLLRTLFFFHPAAHALCRIIDREREHRCDDWVAARCEDRRTYATALVTLARASQSAPLRLSMAATKTPFSNRVHRLFLGDQRPERRFVFSALLVTLLGLGHFNYKYLGADAGATACLEEQSKARQAAIDRMWMQLIDPTTGNFMTLNTDQKVTTAPWVMAELENAPCPARPTVADYPLIAAPVSKAAAPTVMPGSSVDRSTRVPRPKTSQHTDASLLALESVLPKKPCHTTLPISPMTPDPVHLELPELTLDTTPLPPGLSPIRNDDRESLNIAMLGVHPEPPAVSYAQPVLFLNGKPSKLSLQDIALQTIEAIEILGPEEALKTLKIKAPNGVVQLRIKE